MIAAGKLNKRVTIQQQTITRDSYGAETIAWTTFATVWAAVEPLRGEEYFKALQQQANTMIKVTIRYKTGVKATMRFKYGNRYLYIEDIVNFNEANESLVCMCKEAID